MNTAIQIRPYKPSEYDVTQEELNAVARGINHMPRKSLNFLTACEVLNL